MRLPLALGLLSILLLPGCTTPDAEDGPIVLSAGEPGLLGLDTQTGATIRLSPTSPLGWMSPSGLVRVYVGEGNQYVLTNHSLKNVQPAVVVDWSRIEDDVTGVVMQPGRAVRALLTNGTEIASAPLPQGPRPDGTWSGVSADLRIVGAEWPGVTGGQGCQNPIVIREASAGEDDANDVTRTGCHLRVARDGRVGWTEATGVWVRETNGTIRDVTGTGHDEGGVFVAHENPVFTAAGSVFLRLRGGAELQQTEVVTEDGRVLATLAGPTRLALLDASLDGRYLLVRVFGG